jgi:protein-L-isoaspartate(D-aspartate) O-methyltransferase
MEQKTGLIDFWKKQFKFKESELNAFKEVKREYFVNETLKDKAYEDMPLPLLRGKTISQPTTVMIMTSLLELQPGEKVFEIGTGSGYQSAIIAKIVGPKGKVISTEVVPELVHFAKENLKKAKINNVEVHEDDGSNAVPDKTFDKMIITAACKEFPKQMLEKLKPNGIIVGPVGNKQEQEMVKGIKDKDGHLQLEFFGQFIFSPMYGRYGFEV